MPSLKIMISIQEKNKNLAQKKQKEGLMYGSKMLVRRPNEAHKYVVGSMQHLKSRV